MARRYAPVPIASAEARQIYPLARALAPELGLEAWLAFAKRRIGKSADGGIVGVRDEDGYFHALFGYQVRHEFAEGATLEIDLAIAVEMLHHRGAFAVLADEIDAIAVRLGCGAIQVRLRPEQRRLRRRFEAVGHSVRGVVLSKTADA